MDGGLYVWRVYMYESSQNVEYQQGLHARKLNFSHLFLLNKSIFYLNLDFLFSFNIYHIFFIFI